MFENMYRYYYFDLSNRNTSDVSGLSLYINGFNNTKKPIDLRMIIIYEKYATIDCIDGKYTPLTSRFDK